MTNTQDMAMVSKVLLRAMWGLAFAWMCCGTMPAIWGQPAIPAADEIPQRELKLLFLGDQRGHLPRTRFEILQPVLEQRGIALEYTEDVTMLQREKLQPFDGLVLYANIDEIQPAQADALLEFVAKGRGFIPLHCASFCFRNDPRIVALIGGQFREHGTGVFRVSPETPVADILQGYSGFTSWDETYVHHLHATDDRTVLEYRYGDLQATGNQREPWTWLKTHGQGRVFYTAWGHDERTWTKRGFHNLVERGIRWACGDDPHLAGPFREREPFVMPPIRPANKDVAPFEYIDVGDKIPNYLPGQSWGSQGENLSQMQLPVPPAESLKHYVTPENFAPSLFAAEPELGAKPIAMNWDHRGRLWVCQTIDYPNEMRRPGQGNDRLTICEDTDNDGRADKFTVFADQLSIPTAVVCYRNGAIVQDGVRTLFLADTNGDDVADSRHVLIEGWQMGDTHGGVSNFRYGLDNWIWGMQGYNDSHPTTAGKKWASFRMGFFRFRLDQNDPPQVIDLEFVRSTDNNTWGLGISEEGLIFGSTANRNPSVFMPIANRYYERVRGWGPELLNTIADTHRFRPITDKVRQVDHHGGYTAGAGHALYTARAYPESWWNRVAFVNGPTGHLTGIFELIPDGAGFRSTSPGNLLASDDEWAAPILSEVGPDGAVWTIDWYNYIVQHNPTPKGFKTGRGAAYESDLRDKKHGRILRTVYSGAVDPSATTPAQLDPANADSLLAGLKHSNMLWRLQAQRLLIERGQTDVAPQLVKLVADQSVDAIGLNPTAMHALWTLHGLGLLTADSEWGTKVLPAALRHPSAGVRRNALQVLPAGPAWLKLILDTQVLEDSDPQVQLAALLALADQPASSGDSAGEVGAVFQRLLNQPTVRGDRWLRDGLTSAAAMHHASFLAAYLQGARTDSPETRLLAQRVAEHVARSEPNLNGLLQQLTTADVSRLGPVLAGLQAGWGSETRPVLIPETERKLLALAPQLPAEELSQVITITGRLGSAAFREFAVKVAADFRVTLADAAASPDQRVAAATRLIALLPNDLEPVQAIVQAIDLQMAPETAGGLLQALSASRASELPETVLADLASWTPAIKRQGLRLLLGRPEWTRGLVDGIAAGQVSLNDLALDERQALSNHPDQTIREQALLLMKTGGGLPNADRLAVLERYVSSTTNSGDAKRGRELYQEHCSKCHRHGDLGYTVGPELTGMAVHPKEELLEHILDPSRNVEGNFRAYTVLTLDGQVLTGMLAGESQTSIELIDTTGKKINLAREDIEELKGSTKSVMPEGFEEQLDLVAMTDLLEFLTQRGRFLPLDIRKAATLPTDRPMFYGAPGETMLFREWTTQTFEGIPFSLIDPADGQRFNAIMLHGPEGQIPPQLPRQVEIPVNSAASLIHILGGVGGWNAQSGNANGPGVMTVRIRYQDGQTEDHVLRDGVHFADYIGDFNVPESKRAFVLRRGYQVRYLKLAPARPTETIAALELIKLNHHSAPITFALTIESESSH